MRRKSEIWYKKGISLIENLISMALFLVIVLGVLEVFSLSRTHFIKIKTSQEANSAAFASLDKIKADLRACGKGFTALKLRDIAQPLIAENNILTMRQVEKSISLNIPLTAGQIRISLPSTQDFKKGKELYFSGAAYGEIQTIASYDSTSVVLSSPLINSYSVDESELNLLNKISIYFDNSKNVLRRKVNASPAQPLCEEVDSFECSYFNDSNLVKIDLSLAENPENIYEMSVFPKNTALYNYR